MNICILGWYGTETLGDRAILDGIIKIFNKNMTIKNVFLGSLYPFYTERTLWEDKDIIQDGFLGEIHVFQENDIDEMKDAIKSSDIVMMGGGPLSDSKELFLIKSAFRYAKKNNKKRIVFGCGYGPFNNLAMNKLAREIVLLSNINIFRDELSKERACKDVPGLKAFHLADPAIVSILYYSKYYRMDGEMDVLAVNFRSYYKGMSNNTNLKTMLYELLIRLSNSFNKVRLVPMHTFFHGGDDRRCFTDLLIGEGSIPENIEIQYKPQSLYQLYDTFNSSSGCIGMRYHSVVMQTILNGNNIIIDYTKPNEGKIPGFIKELQNGDYYNSRYYNIVEGLVDYEKCIAQLKANEKYSYANHLDAIIDQYKTILKDL